jgi:hypothetical protein
VTVVDHVQHAALVVLGVALLAELTAAVLTGLGVLA